MEMKRNAARNYFLPASLIGLLLTGISLSGCASILDEIAFRKADRIRTADAYEEYLKSHPGGEYVRRVRYRIDRLMYDEARTSNEPGALWNFKQNFPHLRFVSNVESNRQRRVYETLRYEDSISSYRAFIARYKNARTEWTEAATQRLERLLLDVVLDSENTLELERYIFDNPRTPYISEARDALREADFEKAMRSRKATVWEAFIRKYRGSEEAKRLGEHMEAQALWGAERSGRVAALEQFLARYPHSPHRNRIRSSIAMMARERNREAHRWVRVKNAGVEVFRKRKCESCKPYLRVFGTLRSLEPDFSFDVAVQVHLIENGRRCCRTRHWVKHLRPGEVRPFSFPVRNKIARVGSPPPKYEIRVVSGSAYRNPEGERAVEIEGLGGGARSVPRDSFAPVKVPDLPALK